MFDESESLGLVQEEDELHELLESVHLEGLLEAMAVVVRHSGVSKLGLDGRAGQHSGHDEATQPHDQVRVVQLHNLAEDRLQPDAQPQRVVAQQELQKGLLEADVTIQRLVHPDDKLLLFNLSLEKA